MRKIFTLLCLSVMAISMLALPHSRLPQLKADNATCEQVSHSPAQQKAMAMLQYDVTKRIPRTMQMEKTNAGGDNMPLQYVQKATKNTINLDGGVFLVEPEYEAETSEWYIAVESHGYTFRLCWYGPEDNFCGTFDFEDISWDYTWGWYQSSDLFYEIYLADVNMTIEEKQVSKYLKQIVLDATLTDTQDKTYILHIVHEIFTPKSTIEVELENTQLTIGEGCYTLDGNDDKLDIQLTVNSPTVDGAYTQDYFDLNKSKILYNGVEQQILQAEMLVTGGFLDNGALGYVADLSFYNQDTVLYNVLMPAPLPPVKDTIEVSCTNLVVDETYADYGLIMVSGSNDLYDIFAMYEGFYAEPGEYAVSIAITDKITWLEPVGAIHALLTLTEDADGWHANIEVYGNDYNWYSIDMSYVVPVPTDTINISFDDVAVATYIPEQYNMFQMLNYSDDFDASLTVYGIQPGEEFTMDNIYMDYSGIYDYSVGSSVQFAAVKGMLSQKDDTTFITASVIGFNAIQYDVKWWYTVPTPTDTVEIEMPVEFSNALDYGYYILSAYTPDSSVFVSLAPMSDVVAGTFINDGMFGKFGAEEGRYDFFSGNTFIYVSSDWQNYTVEEGSLVVDLAQDGTLTAEANIICSNAICYHIKMTSEYNNHLDYDEPDTPVDRTYTTEDNVTIDDQSFSNGYIYFALTAADDSDMAAFFFYVEEPDPDIIVPVGVYPINYTEEYGTVQANPGVLGDGVWPSFYAEMAEGNLAVPLWLLVGGTVEVSKDDNGNPHLEVNAYNSYGVPVHIVYDGTPTGLSDIQSPTSDTQKILRNGQLLILHNGETYTILGTRTAQ